VDELLEMSTRELSRLEVMQRLVEKRMVQSEAASILDVSRRQIKRLLRVYRREGAKGLVSKRRGKPSNNRLPDATKQEGVGPAEEQICGLWTDPGP
jgi:transposase